MSKERILSYITTHYLESYDFNGIIVNQIPEYDIEELVELIKEDKIFILSEADDINIFINRLNLYKSKEEQIKVIKTDNECIAYPTKEHLKTIKINETNPFTKMLAEGNEQLKIVYFNVGVVELYANNPIYQIYDKGYGGTIFLTNEEEVEDTIHSEYIKNFGVAYPKNERPDADRAIGVFLRDLSNLNFEAQCKWRGFMLPNQEDFLINKNFVQTLICGEWASGCWVFDALLKEMEVINDMCDNMQIPHLFSVIYPQEVCQSLGYRIILVPSLKNYYEFISSLEKIIVSNLNYKTFTTVSRGVCNIDRRREDGILKGSISMLEEWINKNYHSPDPRTAEYFKEDVINVLKDIREIRQIPAHEFYGNTHDKSLYCKQNELINKAYRAIKIIRLIFNRHPSNKNFNIPQELLDENKINTY